VQEPEEVPATAPETADEPVQLNIDEPTVDLVETLQPKKILVAKKFLLARRVFAKVLENLGHEYDALDDMNTLENALASGNYDILFADADLITDRISDYNQNVAIITSSDSNNPREVAVQKGETISSTASKEETQNLITKYRG